jgi:hypothetical protein
MVRTASRSETKRELRWRTSVAAVELRELIGYWEFHSRTENKSAHTTRWYNEALGAFEQVASQVAVEGLGRDPSPSAHVRPQRGRGRHRRDASPTVPSQA